MAVVPAARRHAHRHPGHRLAVHRRVGAGRRSCSSDDDERPSIADAVLYLLRHTHGSDLRFLEAFHDDDLARGTPVNAVGVLSRADEIGACRLDALDVAARVAARYESDQRVRRLCPLVVPVAGLLGQAGTTLREEEYRGAGPARGSCRPTSPSGCCSPPTGSSWTTRRCR